MMDENHPKRGHREYTKARATLLGVLVICVLIEIFIVVIGGSIFVYCANKKAKQSEKIVKSYAENELQYYDTVEWFTSAQNIAQVLNISESKGDKILHHIREESFHIHHRRGQQGLFRRVSLQRLHGFSNHVIHHRLLERSCHIRLIDFLFLHFRRMKIVDNR